jgi:hypothetical protein
VKSNKSIRTFATTLLLLFIFSVSPARGQQPQTRNARVDVQLVDGVGGVIKDGQIVRFKSLSSARDLASQFHQQSDYELSATSIPYGKYEMLVHAEGFADLKIPLDVSQSDVSLQISVRTATVHIVPLNSFGTISLGVITVDSFKDRENEIDWASQFHENTGTNIPYGSYVLQASGDNLRMMPKRVDIFEPEVWVVIGLDVASELPHFIAPTWELNGTITHIPSEEPLYVRLSGVYFDFSMDDKVQLTGSSGAFTFKGVSAWGKYLLITLGSKSGILDIRPIDIRGQNTITIDLSQQRAALLETPK